MTQNLLIAAAAALLLAGCLPSDTSPGAPLEVTRITPETPAIVYHSGLRDPLRTAVFDADKFAELWAQAFAGRTPTPAIPKVDFEREFVVVAALGERSSGGYGIEVASAAREDKGVVIEVLSTAPGKGCMVTLAMTQPVDFVKIPRTSSGAMPVRFVEKPTVRDCGP